MLFFALFPPQQLFRSRKGLACGGPRPLRLPKQSPAQAYCSGTVRARLCVATHRRNDIYFRSPNLRFGFKELSKPIGTYEVRKGPLPELARRIKLCLSNQRLSSTRLARRCDDAAQVLHQKFPEREYGGFRIDDDKLRHLLMWSSDEPKKSALKSIEVEVIEIIAQALHVPADYLLGTRYRRNAILWDPLCDSDEAEHIIHLMNIYEEEAGEFVGWAEFLPCSLETPEFMAKHHEAIFQNIEPRQRRVIVDKFNRIGNARRSRLFDPKRTHSFTELLYLSDLERIVKGAGEYSRIDPELRKTCLLELKDLISQPSLRINLVIAKDDEVGPLRQLSRDCDGIVVNKDKHTHWRTHAGDIFWSENGETVKKHYQWTEQFRQKAYYNEPEKVIALLSAAMDSL